MRHERAIWRSAATATRETSERAAREIESLLAAAGFGEIRIETLNLDPPVVCLLGANNEPGQ